MSGSALALGLLLLVLLPDVALAAQGDLSLGAQVVGALNQPEIGAGVSGDLGLTDIFKLRASVQGRFDDGPAAFMGTAGVVAAFDVLTWVPEISVEAGARLRDGRFSAVGVGMLGIRRYIDLHWSLGLAAGVLWHNDRVRPNAAIGASYDFL